VCREISKLHEESVRGSLSEVVEHFTQIEPRGEIVIVLAGLDNGEKPVKEKNASKNKYKYK
jgi:16S rRNA (cytidine1402-2'-O)-methyltransferase